jgi:stage II sporulation protein D
MRAALRLPAAGLLLAFLASSCAQLSPPRPASPPPQATPPGEKPLAVPAQPARETAASLRLDRGAMICVGLAWDADSLLIEGEALGLGVPGVTDFPDIPSPIKVGAAAAGMRFGRGTTPVSLLPIARSDTLWVVARRGQLRWNGKSWRGTFKIFLNPRGRLTLANHLPLETYLLGVVPGEIGALSEDLIEAGRAQAIAARSYTLFYRGRRASEGFDLYGTVEDQVYGPVESERPLATQCVEQTRGKVALYEGQPIRANYCSTCGGVSAEVWEAWPAAALPYLESRRDGGDGADHCASSPLHRWRERWSEEEFLDNLEHFGPALKLRLPTGGLGDLVDVRAEARSRSGRVWRLLVRTTTGDMTIPAYAIRGALRRGGKPDAILRSTLFKIDVRRDPVTGRAMEVLASGAGSGHGVGLCQTGALGMARAGAKAEEILAQYYPHIVIERLY